MRLVWRRLSPEGFNHELVWLMISVATVVAATAWSALGLIWPRCPFLELTGYPCLTCGATRCSLAFLHGHFLSALRWNPLAFAALCGIAMYDLYAVVVVAVRSSRPRLVDWSALEKNGVRLAVLILIAANWIYLLAHRAQY